MLKIIYDSNKNLIPAKSFDDYLKRIEAFKDGWYEFVHKTKPEACPKCSAPDYKKCGCLVTPR